jgi:hypothetical protein
MTIKEELQRQLAEIEQKEIEAATTLIRIGGKKVEYVGRDSIGGCGRGLGTGKRVPSVKLGRVPVLLYCEDDDVQS